MAFKYRGRSQESVVRRAKESSGSYDSYINAEVLAFKPKEGENQIRIMPRASSEDFTKWGDHWGIDIYIHYDVGPDGGSYLCSDKMKGEPCPVCEARRDEEDQDVADKMKPSRRILCWLVDRNDEKAGPKIWSMPHGTSKDISAVSQVKGTGEALLIDDPEEGFDVYFDREGEKLRTKYKRIEVARDTSPLCESEKLQAKWLEYLEENPLSDILKFYEADHIEKVLFGQGGSKRDEAEADTGRRGGRGRDPEPEARGGRRGREEPLEETESPRRGRGRAEPDDTSQEEPAPRRGRALPPEDDGAEPPFEGSTRRGAAREAPEDAPSRTRRRGEPEAEPDAEPETPRGGRGAVPEEEADTSRRTERVRPGRGEPEPEDTADVKERLSRVGRRGR